MGEYQGLYEAVLTGDAKGAREVTEKALAAGVSALQLVQEYMMPAMDEVGRRFEENEYFVPELLLAARAMKTSLELVRPLLIAGGVEPTAKVVIGTVKGDLHDIGKNLVAAMLEGGGYEVIDIGVNADPEKFVEAVKVSKAQIVAMSALLTTTMPSMRTTIEALKAGGLRDQVKIMIGGAPTTEHFAKEIGADGYSESAAAAVAVARSLL
jgi:corrinoid protein of di/trimethylamine methyltransferase